MVPGVEYFWNTMDVSWSEIQFLWSERWIIEEAEQIIKTYGGNHRKKGRPIDPKPQEIFKELGEEKSRKLIKLVCIVNGKRYEDEKEILDIDVTIGEIKKTIKEVRQHIKVII